MTLLPQTLMKLFAVCAMIGVRTFASFLTFLFFIVFMYPVYDFMIIIIRLSDRGYRELVIQPFGIYYHFIITLCKLMLLSIKVLLACLSFTIHTLNCIHSFLSPARQAVATLYKLPASCLQNCFCLAICCLPFRWRHLANVRTVEAGMV